MFKSDSAPQLLLYRMTTIDSRSTVVKVDGNALIEKINARLERLVEMPATIIEAAAPSDQLIAMSEAAD